MSSPNIRNLQRSGFNLYIYSLVSGVQLQFPGTLTKFSDNYQSNWDPKNLYGRQDPVPTFQNTQRTISFSWKLFADTKVQAIVNIDKVSALIRMLYPGYKDRIINTPPLVRVKLSNLITKLTNGEDAKTDGLLGYFDGLDFSPEMEKMNVYGIPRREIAITPLDEKRSRDFAPIITELSLKFNVLHEHMQGHNIDTKTEGTGARISAFPFENEDSSVAFPYSAKNSIKEMEKQLKESDYASQLAIDRIKRDKVAKMGQAAVNFMFNPFGVKKGKKGKK